MPQSPTVLITGASAGIGRELAYSFAKRGYRLYLVARTVPRLEELARDLRERFRCAVEILPFDLTKPAAVPELVSAYRAREASLDVLVNNAGVGYYGDFAEQPLASVRQILDLNVGALCELTHALLPLLSNGGKGSILNVASTAAYQPGPRMSVYFASKAFVLSFSKALRVELRSRNISVTALCPGPTKTEFEQVAGMSGKRFFNSFWVSDAQGVSEAGVRGLEARKTVVIPGALNRTGARLARILPESWVLGVLAYILED